MQTETEDSKMSFKLRRGKLWKSPCHNTSSVFWETTMQWACPHFHFRILTRVFSSYCDEFSGFLFHLGNFSHCQFTLWIGHPQTRWHWVNLGGCTYSVLAQWSNRDVLIMKVCVAMCFCSYWPGLIREGGSGWLWISLDSPHCWN